MQLRSEGKGQKPTTQAPDRVVLEPAPSLSRYWMHGVAAAALVAMLLFGAGLFFWAERERTYTLSQVRACSAMLVRDLGSRAARLQGSLRELAADPRLHEAFRTGDTESLRAQEVLLSGLLESAFRVRLLLPGYSGDDEPDDQPLSYAGLDLIHQAEREGRVTPLEVHRVGREDMHLAVAGPVSDATSGEVVGVIHVSVPISLLTPVRDMGGKGRYVILFQQRAGGEVVTLDPERRAALPEGEAAYREEVPGTRLQVVAWISRGGPFEGDLPVIVLGVYVLFVLSLALVLWIPLRSARNALAFDYAGIVAIAEDAAGGRPMRRVKWRLAETQPVAEVVGRMLRELTKTKDGGRRAAQPGRRAAPASTRRAPAQDESAFPPRTVEGVESTEEEPGEAVTESAARKTTGPEEPGFFDLGEIDLDEVLPAVNDQAWASASLGEVPERIFRAYDIRGIVGEDLTAGLSRYLGLAVGSEVLDADGGKVFVARDTRPSGIVLTEALVYGLRETGCDVIDLGVVPTPLLYYATRYQGDASGVIVTASHNPPAYNGLKVVVGGVSLEAERIAGLRSRMLAGTFASGNGSYEARDLVPSYIERVEMDVAMARSLRLVVDCGNAAASVVAAELYRALDCEVIEIDSDPEAGFPDGRVPDPTREENLENLRRRVVEEKADLGFAFDGDGDRLGVVDSSGKIIWSDRVLMLLAADVLSRHPGTDVVFDVKCSHHLAGEILRYGGRPVMWRSGHSPLKAKAAETGALLAGEWTGHILFQERWFGFDDALYAGARLLEVLALDPRPTAEVFAALPEAISTPELFVPMAEGEAAKIVAAASDAAEGLQGFDVYRIDGLRLEFDRGWGLIRASNTQPALVFRFEADDESSLEEVKALLRKLMSRAAPEVSLPF